MRRTREITSDFLLVKLGSGWPVMFRDVVEVDRKPVRDRGDRLLKLFLETPRAAPEQARAISSGARRDVFARGWFEVEASSGRVLGAEVTGAAPPGHHSITLTVKYRDDPQLKLMVPIEVQEKYWRHDKPNEDRLEVSSSYSNFRRFQVIVSEQIKAP